MKTKHTPGPWSISKISNLRIDNSNGEIVCALLYATTDGQITPETEANAKLIASAPDLLEALKDAYQVLLARGKLLGLDDQGPVMDKVRAAIAKATE